MHETVLASSLLRIVLDIVGQHAASGQALRVTEIEMDVGVLACLEPVTMKGCFELLAEDTAAADAVLTLRTRPMQGVCSDCGAAVHTERRRFACPLCLGHAVAWEGGNEMEITALKVAPLSGGALA